ncbi:MAG: DUF1634 domain-containing protein [Planctomycetota bacterium]
MAEQTKPRALLSGVVYGECTFWIGILGMSIGIVGMVLYFAGAGSFFDSEALLDGLWAGKRARVIWREAAGGDVEPGHWYLARLSTSDGIAMLGVAISCTAAIVGIWAATLTMWIKNQEPKLFVLLALILAVLLLLSATGVLSVH